MFLKLESSRQENPSTTDLESTSDHFLGFLELTTGKLPFVRSGEKSRQNFFSETENKSARTLVCRAF